VFDPATGRFTLLDMSKAAGYFNNLALADRTFGKLRAAMEASNQWNRSWIIVSADHSWRASAEYDGRRDFRVPFLVKAPGPNQPVVYSPAINTLLTHDLILAILRSELTNQQQVVPWLDSHPTVRAPPPPTLNDD
jgi:arylsulfatase A-like enzyme